MVRVDNIGSRTLIVPLVSKSIVITSVLLSDASEGFRVKAIFIGTNNPIKPRVQYIKDLFCAPNFVLEKRYRNEPS